MPHIKATIAYDGTRFLGWQQQKEGRTIEGDIKAALERMHKAPVALQAAGRTDAGVHANGQVISFPSTIEGLAEDRFARALNNFFPKDIRVRQLEYVADDFHARFDARERVYKYYIYPSELPAPHFHAYSLRIVHKPDLRQLNRLAAKIVGRHDFSTFSAPNEQVPDRVRVVHSACFHAEGPFIVFQICGASFLWRMVRSLVGSLLAYEEEGIDPAECAARLAACDRSLAGPTAPAWGLFLHKVVYKDEQLLF